MKMNYDSRCIALGHYMINHHATVRSTAQAFHISKSTVHTDVTKRLAEISPPLARQVDRILQENKAERHLRGGRATREKYRRLKNGNG